LEGISKTPSGQSREHQLNQREQDLATSPLGSASQSWFRRRYHPSPAKERSTTLWRGKIWNPAGIVEGSAGPGERFDSSVAAWAATVAFGDTMAASVA